MCGIAGSINFRLDIPTLTTDLYHRGPDEQNTFVQNGLQLHHHRLSIVDVACGKQPMQLGPLTIIFNGEIYNHRDLRRQYNLACTTNSDTETLLHLYRLKGAGMLQDLEGMFALAIYDEAKSELFVARDRAGKKPLYFFNDGKRIVFCSELRALSRQLSLAVKEEAIYQYLHLGFLNRQTTPYENVFELEAGTYCRIDVHTLQLNKQTWWSIRDYYLAPSPDNLTTALEKTDDYLHKAIQLRLESSDLEVGSFLSGGIDSGVVTAIASKFKPGLKTFTVSFPGAFDEAPLAALVAKQYRTDHTEISISFDNLKNDIEKILLNYGEPFADSSAIPSYYVSREAKKHLTVILNGDGGDELFGGYRRYVPFAKFDFFKSSGLLRTVSRTMGKLLPYPKDKRSKYNYVHRLIALAGFENPVNYLSSTTDVFTGYERFFKNPDTFPQSFADDVSRVSSLPLSGLQKIMLLDFDHILPDDLLVKMDIATMAHSLEGRSPLLSKYLLQYIPTLSDDLKIHGKTTKFLLRRLAEKYLPAPLIHQPKRGFEIPLKAWVENDLSEIIMDYLTAPNAYSRSFFDPAFYGQLLNHSLSVSAEKRAKMLWNLFALELWYTKSTKHSSLH